MNGGHSPFFFLLLRWVNYYAPAMMSPSCIGRPKGDGEPHLWSRPFIFLRYPFYLGEVLFAVGAEFPVGQPMFATTGTLIISHAATKWTYHVLRIEHITAFRTGMSLAGIILLGLANVDTPGNLINGCQAVFDLINGVLVDKRHAGFHGRLFYFVLGGLTDYKITYLLIERQYLKDAHTSLITRLGTVGASYASIEGKAA
ncbi:hypothetical protein MBAV_001097 [Candidatus Magnetobacterium bavaricum]|uniref:Uncharacterized protein n=1 Tax=Candidatus Magnetobacterium bavaricum TaxID=29290 RepID=A0A0F3GXW0_9BACT|nr:hypothetical protein MBAV_001097 [Candidatus Magnetobacterium bavaricum]